MGIPGEFSARNDNAGSYLYSIYSTREFTSLAQPALSAISGERSIRVKIGEDTIDKQPSIASCKLALKFIPNYYDLESFLRAETDLLD